MRQEAHDLPNTGRDVEMRARSLYAMEKTETRSKPAVPVSGVLRDTIRERGWTAYKAAKRAGVSVDAIQRFLNRQRGLTLATVDKLAASLGLSLCPDRTPSDQRGPDS
jgi:hypothetical protein